VLAITDEIYEHIVYDGARHIPMATIAGMEDRTITISALSKSYIMCDASVPGMGDDTATARALTREVGVAAVPGSSFYSRPELGRSKIRFSYSKKLATLHEAGRRLARLATDPA
jgi:aspartate/methionine/tyrosine aminotransferase